MNSPGPMSVAVVARKFPLDIVESLGPMHTKASGNDFVVDSTCFENEEVMGARRSAEGPGRSVRAAGEFVLHVPVPKYVGPIGVLFTCLTQNGSAVAGELET